MKCSYCGNEIANNSQFCEYCGKQVVRAKSLKPLWITLAMLLVLCIVGGVSYYLGSAPASADTPLVMASDTTHEDSSLQDEAAKQEIEQLKLELEAAEQARKAAERKAKAEAEAEKAKAKAEAEAEKAKAKAEAEAEKADSVFLRVEHPAEFPGGSQAMMQFLSNNVKYPVAALEDGIQGKAICQFTVNKDGSIVDVEVVRSSGNASLDKEAIRVIKTMPKWKPAQQRGKSVRSKFTLPIVFRLQN